MPFMIKNWIWGISRTSNMVFRVFIHCMASGMIMDHMQHMTLRRTHNNVVAKPLLFLSHKGCVIVSLSLSPKAKDTKAWGGFKVSKLKVNTSLDNWKLRSYNYYRLSPSQIFLSRPFIVFKILQSSVKSKFLDGSDTMGLYRRGHATSTDTIIFS